MSFWNNIIYIRVVKLKPQHIYDVKNHSFHLCRCLNPLFPPAQLNLQHKSFDLFSCLISEVDLLILWQCPLNRGWSFLSASTETWTASLASHGISTLPPPQFLLIYRIFTVSFSLRTACGWEIILNRGACIGPFYTACWGQDCCASSVCIKVMEAGMGGLLYFRLWVSNRRLYKRSEPRGGVSS